MTEHGPNLLSAHGAATMIGRDGAQVQIRITCRSEDEAKAIITNFRANIEHHGYAVMHFGGTMDDGEKELMDANLALKSYRQKATEQPNMSKALAGFQQMNPGDQRELLFWMIMTTNHHLAQALNALGVQFAVNTPPPPDN